MPQLIYVSEKDNFKSRLLLHPERVLPAWWGTLGLLLLYNMLRGRFIFKDSTLENFHWPVVLGAAVALFGSGALILFVQIRKNDTDSKAWRYERLGWTLGIGGWLTYGIAVYTYGTSFITLSLPIAMTALCIVRLKALKESETRLRNLIGA